MNGRILVVDDDDVVRANLRSKLESSGYEVVDVSNGEDAIQRMGEETFHLVITDILMPERDGLETLLHIKKTQPDVPVIAITGAGNELCLDNARGLGAARVFEKPFELEELAAAVEQLILVP